VSLGRATLLNFDPTEIEAALSLSPPPQYSVASVLRQFRAVLECVRKLGCRSVIVEPYYVDRDHMEDHRVFYSACLYPYSNACRRLHFFTPPADKLAEQLQQIVADVQQSEAAEYQQICRNFSRQSYLGFSVIRPLPGCPVGRTIIRFPSKGLNGASESDHRVRSGRNYAAHVHGLELTVEGLPFQQQDEGVSACATTALWSSIQQHHAHEYTQPVSPSRITSLATQHLFPTGRDMPSKGLSLQQACSALNTLGIAASVFSAEHEPVTARRVILAALDSGFAPVLFICDGENPGVGHAVTVAGAVMSSIHRPSPILLRRKDPLVEIPLVDDVSNDIDALLIHDDRIGPYCPASLKAATNLQLTIAGSTRSASRKGERWNVKCVLTPLYPKVRISLQELIRIGDATVGGLRPILDHYAARFGKGLLANPLPIARCWVERSHLYVRNCILHSPRLSLQQIEELSQSIKLSRYVGVIRLQMAGIGIADVLLDTTCTIRNFLFLGVTVRSDGNSPHVQNVWRDVSNACGKCPIIV
jgi:hypothetical protein